MPGEPAKMASLLGIIVEWTVKVSRKQRGYSDEHLRNHEGKGKSDRE
jgi:hypothetical protein